ncbi:MAG: toll/interleukin-1 receptor domain-containing protein, partial [Planctomycetota bacterium]
MSAKVFLCHAHEDQAVVMSVHQRLLDEGFCPWVDKVDLLPGQAWQQEIKKSLTAADVVIVFLSHMSVAKRGYVQREFKLSLETLKEIPEGQIYVIPVKVDDCTVPDSFAELQWVHLDDPGIEKIIKTIRRYFPDQTTRHEFVLTYRLNSDYHFASWNEAFKELIALPLTVKPSLVLIPSDQQHGDSHTPQQCWGQLAHLYGS